MSSLRLKPQCAHAFFTFFSRFSHDDTGGDGSWASPKDQDVYFSDFSVAITQKL